MGRHPSAIPDLVGYGWRCGRCGGPCLLAGLDCDGYGCREKQKELAPGACHCEVWRGADDADGRDTLRPAVLRGGAYLLPPVVVRMRHDAGCVPEPPVLPVPAASGVRVVHIGAAGSYDR